MRVLTILLLLFAAVTVKAQWNTSGTHIYNNNSGNTGIGTPSPGMWFSGKVLEIYDTRPILKLHSTGTVSTISFTQNTINSTTHEGEFHLNHHFNSANHQESGLIFHSYPKQNILAMKSNGNVGIGTSSPNHLLDVNGTINATSILVNGQPLSGGGSSIWSLLGANTYFNTGNVGIGTTNLDSKLSIEGANQWQIRLKDTGAGSADWRIGSTANTWYAGGGKFMISNEPNSDRSAFTIDIQKRVGIGTISPSEKLHVEGNITSTGTINASSFTINGQPFTGGNSQWITSGSDIHYFAGKVGIGTSDADEKLTVKGNIHAEEVIIDLEVAAPDYVFEEDYDLKPLSDVEHYIKQNKHLPEVPPAIEMEAEGIRSGEMNMLLLKKVEELTLYVIELEKKVKRLEKSHE